MSDDVLRDLARAKVAFQLRAIETIIRGSASAIDARQRPDTEEWLDPKGESAAPKEGAPTKSLYSLKDVG